MLSPACYTESCFPDIEIILIDVAVCVEVGFERFESVEHDAIVNGVIFDVPKEAASGRRSLAAAREMAALPRAMPAMNEASTAVTA